MNYYHQTASKLGIVLGVCALFMAASACGPAIEQSSESQSAQAEENPADQAAASETGTQAKVEVLATYSAGTLLENLEVQTDGRVLVTSYFSKSIELVTPEGAQSTFATLTAHPVSLISTASGYLVAAHGKSFLEGEDFVTTQQFLLLDKDGDEIGQFAAPQSVFLNGTVRLDDANVLVADSLAGIIWKVDVGAQEITPWLQDELLTMRPEQDPFFPGANGLKFRSDGLVVSNSSRGNLSLIKIDEQGNPVGEIEQLADTGLVDDFWITEDDTIIFTTHLETLKSLSADGVITEILSEGCGGCTAIAPLPLNQSKTFVVINDGNLYLGEKTRSAVLKVTVE